MSDPINEAGRKEPIRTCLACRRRRPQRELRRLALERTPETWKVIFDDKRRLGGRGAWLCPEAGCLALAVKKRVFGRAFRRDKGLDLSALETTPLDEQVCPAVYL